MPTCDSFILLLFITIYFTDYSGCVPRKFLFTGDTEVGLSNKGLVLFDKERADRAIAAKKPFHPDRPEVKLCSSINLYPENSGMIKYYAGHIPGNLQYTTRILYLRIKVMGIKLHVFITR